METLTFNELPGAVAKVYERLGNIENMLLNRQNSPPESDQLLSVKETAEFLKMSVTSTYGLVHRSMIPNNKIGNRVWFSKEELIAWIKSGRRPTASESADQIAGKGGSIE